MPARIDPELNLRLEVGDPGPFGVAIEFATTPGADEASPSGLSSGGRRVVGRLTAAQIRKLLDLPEVLSVSLAPEAPAAAPASLLSPKFGPRLARILRDTDQAVIGVVVTFREPPVPPPNIPGLAVRGPMGHGNLRRDGVEALASLDSVLAIEALPEYRAVSPRLRLKS